MFSSFLNSVRAAISVCVLVAFLHGQASWSMGTEPLTPGAPLKTARRQQTPNPAQPGEVQQPQPTPPNEGQTTVVQVPVPKDTGLDITVVDGDGASNVVAKKSSVKPMVQVRDEKNQLLEGAVVTFIAPGDGPSVIFSNGLRTVTVMTDAEGRARAPSMRAVNSGAFRIQVSASFRGQMVSTTIAQTNFDSSAEARGQAAPDKTGRPTVNKAKSGLSGTAIAVILGAGAAAAVGIGVGLGHKGSSSSSTSTTTATIGSPGTPTVGGPH